MSKEEDPDQQYTTDGDREDPEQMPGRGPEALPKDQRLDPSELEDDDKVVPEGTGGARTEGGAGMIQTE
jgi:hypothetical protein